jgi:hypothetical protein
MTGALTLALVPMSELTDDERGRTAKLLAMPMDDFVREVEDYANTLDAADQRIYWSQDLAVRTLHALDEASRVYNAMLNNPGEVAPAARPQFNQLIARIAAHRKLLNAEIRAAAAIAAAAGAEEEAAMSLRARAGRVCANVHPKTNARARALLKDGIPDEQVVQIIKREMRGETAEVDTEAG